MTINAREGQPQVGAEVGSADRGEWVRPAVIRLDAGGAEQGAAGDFDLLSAKS